MENQHIFYTTSDTNHSLINQIEIDFENATYNVWYDIENYLSDDHIFDDNDIDSTYVSDEVFDFILEGLGALGYKRIGGSDDAIFLYR